MATGTARVEAVVQLILSGEELNRITFLVKKHAETTGNTLSIALGGTLSAILDTIPDDAL